MRFRNSAQKSNRCWNYMIATSSNRWKICTLRRTRNESRPNTNCQNLVWGSQLERIFETRKCLSESSLAQKSAKLLWIKPTARLEWCENALPKTSSRGCRWTFVFYASQRINPAGCRFNWRSFGFQENFSGTKKFLKRIFFRGHDLKFFVNSIDFLQKRNLSGRRTGK